MDLFPLFYCGNICYYKCILHSKKPVFDLHEYFVKQTYRNRMEILGPNGRQKLVIPTSKTGERRTMSTVEISYSENWQKDHWKSMESAYRRSPYFEFYEDRFQPFYKNEYKLLSEYNLSILRTICQILRIEKELGFSGSYEDQIEGSDFRNEEFNNCETLERYIQVFEDRHPFISNLSILDAIFNLGPRARLILLPDERE